MIYRKKHIDAFREMLKDEDIRIIAITGEKGIGKSTFLKECETFDVFGPESHYQHINLESDIDMRNVKITDGISFLIIDSEQNIQIDTIRTFIESYSSELRIIYTTESEIIEEWVASYMVPIIGLREYLEHENGEVKITDILSWEIDIDKLNKYRDIYLTHGGFPMHLLWNQGIYEDFDIKRTLIKEELYEKEYEIFETYLRTIAMNTGNLFKADQIAKLLDISRRKVNKYTELILKHNLVEAIGPWVQNTTTETSRHVKLYFRELSYMKAILWDIHAEWAMRQWAMENMIFLELKRKLEDTHVIYFYRKKSGSEITFIAENTENTLVTPMMVTTRSSDAIPQALKVFDEEYHDRVERYMILNDAKSNMTEFSGLPLMILPHIGI